MCEQIKTLLKDFDESKAQKYSEVLLPSFTASVENKELNTNQAKLQLSNDVGAASMNGGCFSAEITLISGLPPNEALNYEMPSFNGMASGETIFINEPFVFALNDQ